MRKTWSLLMAFCLVAVAAGCEGPVGPQGPAGSAGAAGPAGPAGPAGANGKDANASCTQCHVGDEALYAKQLQYQNSQHYNGTNYTNRNSGICSLCHTSQGFRDRVENGNVVGLTVNDPAPQNCRTCHKIHTTYTSADYARTVTKPVALWANPGTTVDFGAHAGNLCATCHQSRPFSPMPVIGGDPVVVTSSRFGAHYSPVAQVLGGVGAYAFSGSANITGGPFTHGDPAYNPKSCATCHMATAIGRGLDIQAGGHTWKMSYEYNGSETDNVAGCNSTGCHKTVEDFDHWSVRAEIDQLMNDLADELVRIGIKTADSEVTHPRNKTGTWPADVAAAFLNLQIFAEDKSHGLHNPPYVRNVLKNSIAVMKTY